jgi:hypothetical protein
MLVLLKKLLLFRIGQKTSRRVARKMGFHALAPLIGVTRRDAVHT